MNISILVCCSVISVCLSRVYTLEQYTVGSKDRHIFKVKENGNSTVFGTDRI
jgi:hypothetical protein